MRKRRVADRLCCEAGGEAELRLGGSREPGTTRSADLAACQELRHLIVLGTREWAVVAVGRQVVGRRTAGRGKSGDARGGSIGPGVAVPAVTAVAGGDDDAALIPPEVDPIR